MHPRVKGHGDRRIAIYHPGTVYRNGQCEVVGSPQYKHAAHIKLFSPVEKTTLYIGDDVFWGRLLTRICYSGFACSVTVTKTR